MITSASNPQIKNIIQLNTKAKARKEQGLFVVEGEKMCNEVPVQWVEQIYVSSSYAEKKADDGWYGRFEVVDDRIFRQICNTQTPQGILITAHKPSYKWEDVLGKGGESLLVVLENLQDPGNVGTILRSAEAAGASGVVMTPECADLFNPKTIRSTMGSIFRMPFLVEEIEAIQSRLRNEGVRMFAAHLEGSVPYDSCSYCEKTAFLIGNEGAGLTREAADGADQMVRIPMEGEVESLNAAMAASILMFEASRQRRI